MNLTTDKSLHFIRVSKDFVPYYFQLYFSLKNHVYVKVNARKIVNSSKPTFLNIFSIKIFATAWMWDLFERRKMEISVEVRVWQWASQEPCFSCMAFWMALQRLSNGPLRLLKWPLCRALKIIFTNNKQTLVCNLLKFVIFCPNKKSKNPWLHNLKYTQHVEVLHRHLSI
jgi:hypothetical protein